MSTPPNTSPVPSPGIDLHAHTTASDGSLSPTELVEKAHALGLAALAVTDHDTLAGLAEARRRHIGSAWIWSRASSCP